MSSDSETEERFFDAEDITPIRTNSKSLKTKSKLVLQKEDCNSSEIQLLRDASKAPQKESSWEAEDEIKTTASSEVEKKEIERKAVENEKRRRRLEELRRRVINDDDDSFDVPSVTSSQTSSVDSLYLRQLTQSSRTTCTAEKEDSSSMISLGKVGQILSGNEAVTTKDPNGNNDAVLSSSLPFISNVSRPQSEYDDEGNITLTARSEMSDDAPTGPSTEPDIVASTKFDRPSELPYPVAPPRRKRRPKPIPTPTTDLPAQHLPETLNFSCIPSPASTVESIAKEFENSLDLKSAVMGQYVVKPQDEEKDKAEGPPPKSEGASDASSTVQADASGGEPVKGCMQQLNMVVRTRTDSGKQLTDLEILEQILVLNLDTGEQIPLSVAEDRLPRGINPLSLHIMRLTSEYVSNSSLDKEKESDEDADDSKKSSQNAEHTEGAGTRRKTRFKKLLNKTVSKIKSVADEVYHARHNEEIESSEEEPTGDAKQAIKFKAASCHKGPYEFDNLKVIQDLGGEHVGAVWTMKFSYCGRLLATAGQDHVLRVWILSNAYEYFSDMRQKYSAETKISPTASQESLVSQPSTEDCERVMQADDQEESKTVFKPKAFCTYSGHTADLLDVSWSKNYFILSSSMDKTVRLWHISRKECLCCFQHIDFVTAIAFHPRDDRYFISGSLDGKLRLWNIPDKKVALWNELDGQTKLITSANFCQNGKFAVVGSYDGRCVFYNTEQLKYYTQIHVRSTRGKNAKGRKISGIEPMPGEDKILVTSNDSRIRLYDLRDLSLSCKYKGYVNLSSQIRASFSHDGKFIISGSENQSVYLWKTHHDYPKFSSARRDRNEFWEGIKAHQAVVTAAVFAPNPALIFQQMEQAEKANATEDSEGTTPAALTPESSASTSTATSSTSVASNSAATASGSSANPSKTTKPSSESSSGYVFVTADFNGGIKVFASKSKPKSST